MEAIQIKLVPINDIQVQYSSYIQKNGQEASFSKIDGQMSGTEGKALSLENIKIRLMGVENGCELEYQTHVQNIGWQNWKKDGEMAGTNGMGLRLEAIRIKLKNMTEYSIMYRAHIQNIGWQEWKKDGEMAGTEGKALRLEAIEIKIVKKDSNNLNNNDKDENENITIYKHGIDVSTYQGNIDWSLVKKQNIDFAIIRAGYRGYGVSSDGTDGKLVTDKYFNKNMQGAIFNGIDVGVYFFTQAKNEVEAIAEARYTLDLVKDYNITYPIVIDTEWSGSPTRQGRADSLSKDKRTKAVKAFCETIKEAGYQPMIYANPWWITENLNISELSEYPLWLAHYTGAEQSNPLLKPSNYQGNYKIWQYTDKGIINGITGSVDLNIEF